MASKKRNRQNTYAVIAFLLGVVFFYYYYGGYNLVIKALYPDYCCHGEYIEKGSYLPGDRVLINLNERIFQGYFGVSDLQIVPVSPETLEQLTDSWRPRKVAAVGDRGVPSRFTWRETTPFSSSEDEYKVGGVVKFSIPDNALLAGKTLAFRLSLDFHFPTLDKSDWVGTKRIEKDLELRILPAEAHKLAQNIRTSAPIIGVIGGLLILASLFFFLLRDEWEQRERS